MGGGRGGERESTIYENTYSLRVFNSMQIQTVIHGGLIIQSTSFKAKIKLLQKPQLELRDRKGLFGGTAPALSIPVDLPGQLLFIHITGG